MANPRERPILFSGPMASALLAGRKTVTRRLVKPQPTPCDYEPGKHALAGQVIEGNPSVLAQCPYGKPGDRLWVKETWRPEASSMGHRLGWKITYLADGAVLFSDLARVDASWRCPKSAKTGNVTPLFMPRWASRLTLEVVSVRVERLHDITEEDAVREGAFFTDYGRRCFHDWKGPGPCPAPPEHHQQRDGWSMVATKSNVQCLGSARMAFANLFNQIHAGPNWSLKEGPAPWDLNPWVWRVEFRKVDAPAQEVANG